MDEFSLVLSRILEENWTSVRQSISGNAWITRNMLAQTRCTRWWPADVVGKPCSHRTPWSNRDQTPYVQTWVTRHCATDTECIQSGLLESLQTFQDRPEGLWRLYVDIIWHTRGLNQMIHWWEQLKQGSCNTCVSAKHMIIWSVKNIPSKSKPITDMAGFATHSPPFHSPAYTLWRRSQMVFVPVSVCRLHLQKHYALVYLCMPSFILRVHESFLHFPL